MSYFLDSELRALTAAQLKQEKQSTSSQLLHVQQQISDLAYGNYRIYADAGSTTEQCKQLFGKANDLVGDIEKGIESIRESLKQFDSKNDEVVQELHHLQLAESKSSRLWDILSLPMRMDICIRAGYYDMAYLLTNYGVQLQTHGLTKNSIIKQVADKLIDARYHLLDELFNTFAGPIDLANSIQVVNNIRKIPYLSSTQMRIMILQYRDVYLEKRLLDIRSQPDFILRMVEVYRDCMYDTMVLHLAVFPENEISRRQTDLSVDQRWDVWQTAASSVILSEWAVHNLAVMFSRINNISNEVYIDIGSLSSKLMSFALSFGRMGMDFRPMIAEIIDKFVINRFSLKVQNAANNLKQCRSIEIDGEIPDTVFSSGSQDGKQPSAPSVLAFWDDLCVYGNALIDALNELRNGLSPTQINAVLKELTNSVKIVICWLCDMEKLVKKAIMEKAVKLFGKYFIPYINGCLLTLYPYEKCCRPFYHTNCTLGLYEKMCAIQIKEICKDCPNSTVIEKLLEEANNSMNEFVGSILTVTNGNAEYSGTNVPDNNGVPQEEVVKLSLDEDVKIDAQRDSDQHEAKDHSPINKLEDNSAV
ncbi:Conserved oligomeric Golgi complex component 8, putative [Brugia malayi]|uniref:Conserved oligomeric Golgi complex subunit 8 n=1 Tax=Brugia malayi TaxID=6279 RepID=A0A0H5SIM0_BRUMA|nr:Conserved oligomeric Golgi complex component 8, putative [Brugia malayi]CRZ23670.1 BMA-COGC-8 [Brugia malayi]VIO92901.1 Conserved oligomeric Golgi complex component 8, putative [Brugia malayi]